MSKIIDLHLSQIRFPPTCVVCASPALKTYELQKNFISGRKSYTVKLNVPMCEHHFQSATLKGTAEKVIGKLSVILGALTALIVIILCMRSWQSAGAGNVLPGLFAGGIFGLGSFFTVWAGISVSVAPLFAKRGSKEARHAVQFKRYWPKDQFVRLEFRNEELADIVHNTYRSLPKIRSRRMRTPG